MILPIGLQRYVRIYKIMRILEKDIFTKKRTDFNKLVKRVLLIFLSLMIFSCKSVEERVKDSNVTNEWYYIDTMRFEVYKTHNGRRYIIVLNNRQTRYVRQYIDAKK
jgi:hypothetical protein